MLAWLQNNYGTIIVLAVVIAVVALIIVKMVSDKRKGRTTCSHGCANCSMHDQCHKVK